MNTTQRSNLKQNVFDMLAEIRLNELNTIDAAKAKDIHSLRELQQNDRELTYKEALR